MIDVLEALEQLFSEHAPETLMALFGAATSLLLFYLIWYLLRHMLGQMTQTTGQEAGQDQSTAFLVETLVGELLAEAEHLRCNLQDTLQAVLRRSDENTEALSALVAQAEQTPEQFMALLKPEFDHLRLEMRLAESRITAKVEQVFADNQPEQG